MVLLIVASLDFSSRCATVGIDVGHDYPCLVVHILLHILHAVSSFVYIRSVDFGRPPCDLHLLECGGLLVKGTLHCLVLVRVVHACLLRLVRKLLQTRLAVSVPVVAHHLELLVLHKPGSHRVFGLQTSVVYKLRLLVVLLLH